MRLKQWAKQKISILDIYGNVWNGVVIDYLFPDENDSGSESIIIKTNNGKLVEFEESDINQIKAS